MAEPYETLPLDTTSNEEKIARKNGTVIFNNTSFSGADIKLVVHVYDSGQTAQLATASLKDDVASSYDRLKTLLGLIDQLEASIATKKMGTPEYLQLTNQLNRTRAEYDVVSRASNYISDRVTKEENDKPTVSRKVLADVQTISISSHRVKEPVRACGCVYPKGYVRGQRMIAGSIIFTVFDQHALYELIEAHPTDFDANTFTSALLDQMPPMDITIAFANEYGQVSRMAIYGVEFVNEGQTMSIEDILTENACQYVARDFDPMGRVGHAKMDGASGQMIEWATKSASDLILEDEYQNTGSMWLDPFARMKGRNNPFI